MASKEIVEIIREELGLEPTKTDLSHRDRPTIKGTQEVLEQIHGFTNPSKPRRVQTIEEKLERL